LVSAFNGLTQRVWDEARARAHLVAVKVYDDAEGAIAAANDVRPDLVLCPYLKSGSRKTFGVTGAP
jgi:putative two-component system hydrogenase maturation factor HypX/HoxX